MDKIEEIPPGLQAELKILFAALEQCPSILSIGRAFGLAVGISPRVAHEMMKLNGEDAPNVIANCRKIAA